MEGVTCTFFLLYTMIGELALQGCTVHIYDQDSLQLQMIHSTISAHLQQLRDQGLLSEGYQLQVSTIYNMSL